MTAFRHVLAITVLWSALIPDAQAQAMPPPDEQRIMQTVNALPPRFRDFLLDPSESYLTQAITVIGNHGGPDGIDRTAIDLFIGVTRAKARSRVTSRVMDADLMADGVVHRSEVEQLCLTLSSSQRGQMRRLFDRSDADRNGQISTEEMHLIADAEAAKAVSDTFEMILHGLPRLDIDGDGLVSVAELVKVVAVAGASAAKVADTGATPGKTDL